MSIQDVVNLMIYLVNYCAPAALIINLSSWGANVIIGAVSGRGLHLDGRFK